MTFPPLLSLNTSPVSRLPSSSPPSPPYPSSLETTIATGRDEVDRQHDCWVGGGEVAGWTPAEVEDDSWLGRGEFDRQKWWRMTAGRGGVNLTASRGGE